MGSLVPPGNGTKEQGVHHAMYRIWSNSVVRHISRPIKIQSISGGRTTDRQRATFLHIATRYRSTLVMTSNLFQLLRIGLYLDRSHAPLLIFTLEGGDRDESARNTRWKGPIGRDDL